MVECLNILIPLGCIQNTLCISLCAGKVNRSPRTQNFVNSLINCTYFINLTEDTENLVGIFRRCSFQSTVKKIWLTNNYC